MERRKVDKSFERQLLTGMIVSTQFLKEVSLIYHPALVTNRATKLIAQWCLEYYQEYKKAPTQHIEDIIESKSRDGLLDEEILKYIEDLMESLSKEWEHAEKFNADYLLDITEKEFNKIKAENLAQDIKAELAGGNTKEADKLIMDYRPVQRPASVGIDPFSDKEAIKKAFEESLNPLFKLPGELGGLLNRQLVRGGFIAFMGKEKIGKSHNLQELGLCAMLQNCNVALFDTGDMTQEERIQRVMSRITKQPLDNIKEVLMPVLDCEKNQKNRCDKAERTNRVGFPEEFDIDIGDEGFINEVKELNDKGYTPCSVCRKPNTRRQSRYRGTIWYIPQDVVQLTWIQAFRKAKVWQEEVGKFRFKLSIHPSDSLNSKGIIHKLDVWERDEGFIPDVIIIDYADIMAPEDSTKSERGQENDRWKALRKLSQTRHCLVITATQTDAGAYNKRSVGLENYSEDKRKYAHVTAFYSFNQDEDEKKKGVIRWGEMLARSKHFDIKKKVSVSHCLDICLPVVTTYFS